MVQLFTSKSVVVEFEKRSQEKSALLMKMIESMERFFSISSRPNEVAPIGDVALNDMDEDEEDDESLFVDGEDEDEAFEAEDWGYEEAEAHHLLVENEEEDDDTKQQPPAMEIEKEEELLPKERKLDWSIHPTQPTHRAVFHKRYHPTLCNFEYLCRLPMHPLFVRGTSAYAPSWSVLDFLLFVLFKHLSGIDPIVKHQGREHVVGGFCLFYYRLTIP